MPGISGNVHAILIVLFAKRSASESGSGLGLTALPVPLVSDIVGALDISLESDGDWPSSLLLQLVMWFVVVVCGWTQPTCCSLVFCAGGGWLEPIFMKPIKLMPQPLILQSKFYIQLNATYYSLASIYIVCRFLPSYYFIGKRALGGGSEDQR